MRQQGIYSASELPIDEYIADPCPEPSISTGVVVDICTRSPLHAKINHPRYGAVSDDSTRADIGSAAHSVLLGGAVVSVIDADNYRTKTAREQRDFVRSMGQIPILAKHATAVDRMVGVAREAWPWLGDVKREHTLIWLDGGVWCKSRPDAVAVAIADYKTTANADPQSFIRTTLFPSGYDVQAALAIRGARALGLDVEAEAHFLVQEIDPPYACATIGLDEQAMVSANRKIDYAIRVWGECLQSQKWPGYDTRVHWAEAPAWLEWDQAEREVSHGV